MKQEVPPSGLAYVREKQFEALVEKVEALEKLTEEQTKTIISFTEHTNALMSRIETIEKEMKLYKYKSLIDQMREDGEI